jgi:hypothetical protein
VEAVGPATTGEGVVGRRGAGNGFKVVGAKGWDFGAKGSDFGAKGWDEEGA